MALFPPRREGLAKTQWSETLSPSRGLRSQMRSIPQFLDHGVRAPAEEARGRHERDRLTELGRDPKAHRDGMDVDPSVLGDGFDHAVTAFGEAYADQTERDHAALVAAVKAGRLQAQTGL